jgi:cysteine desulfurase
MYTLQIKDYSRTMNNKPQMIYLDNNATTQVAPEVVSEMLPYFLELYANPSSLHFFGEKVAERIRVARDVIAKSINASSDEVFFTASGSEGDNLCIKGFAEANQKKGKHIITSCIEHPAILNACAHLEQAGWKVTYLSVDSEGFVSTKDLENAITEETVLVSIMHANNEVGTIQPITEFARICHEHNVVFHTDAVQSFLKTGVDVEAMGIDMASFSGHKIHAPKGIGFIYVRKGIQLTRQIDGGGQESKLRAGTENTPYILGLAKAIELSTHEDINKMQLLQSYLIERLRAIDGVRINGPLNLEKRVCNNINFSTVKMAGDDLLKKLSTLKICVSTGSACSSKSTKVSPVLEAIKCPAEYIHGNIRVSLSKYSTKEEIDILFDALHQILRSSNTSNFNFKKI